MSNRDDKIVELIRRLSRRASGKANRSGCPDEEGLVDFLAGRLEKDVSGTIEIHLSHCAFCLDDLVAAYKSGELATSEAVPQRLVDKVMELVKAQPETLFHLVVRLVRGTLELISTSGRIVTMAAPVLRGEAQPVETNALQVEQKVGRFRIAVELDLSEAGVCQVVAHVREDAGKPAEGVRLSLSSGGREQASFLTRAGTVVFDRIAPGEYGIAVSESGVVVGRIKLSLIL